MTLSVPFSEKHFPKLEPVNSGAVAKFPLDFQVNQVEAWEPLQSKAEKLANLLEW